MAKILIGISGSIAAYKSVLFIRELTKHGHTCKVILTTGGAQFVTPQLIAGLGCDIYSDENLDLTNPSNAMLHINLAKWAERFIIAPASANCLAKLANGFADNLLTTAVLAYGNQTIYLAPAMNQQMWLNRLTAANLRHLKQHNFVIWEPQHGIQACGDIGQGRMLEAEQLLTATLATFGTQGLKNKIILITLGATVEPIDPVRYISNHSSGKMGVALIKQALFAGARVIAIHGKLNPELLPTDPHLELVEANTAQEMLTATIKYAKNSDLLIGCAAVCDYRVKEISKHKLKKSNNENSTLELIKNPDILATVKAKFPELITVGFAAETQNIIENAKQKLIQKNLDLVIANDVSSGKVFGEDTTQISLVDKTAPLHEFPSMTKDQAASIIIRHISQHLCQP